MNPDLIRYARKHRYAIAEGFCDERGSFEVAVETAVENLRPKQRKWIKKEAEALAIAAGIPLDEAHSAYLNWILEKHIETIKARMNN